MPGISTKEAAKIDEKRSRLQRDPGGKEPDPAPLDQMTGRSVVEVDLYGNTYEIAPYLLAVAGKASKLLQSVPMAIIAYAYADPCGDPEAIAEMLSRMTGLADDDALNASDGTAQMDALVLNLPEDSVGPMLDAATLAIQRKHPEFTRDMAGDLIDTSNMLEVFRAIFQVNKSRKRRF
jgi:hypothetical protein